MARVILEIGRQLTVRRIIGVIVRHRVIVILRERARADDVRGLEDARMARIGVEHPVAADLAAAIVDDEIGEPRVEDVLGGGDPRRAGADDADPAHAAASSVFSSATSRKYSEREYLRFKM